MHHTDLVFRTLLMAACGAFVALQATDGNADPTPSKNARACMGAYRKAQELERDAHLLRAKEAMLTCAKPACGAALAGECASRYAQLGTEIPSVVLLAEDDTGAPVVDVQVTMDGAPVASKLDGRAISLDPGLHEFAFGTGRGAIVQSVLIAQGQRNRSISVSLRGKEALQSLQAQSAQSAQSAQKTVSAPPTAQPVVQSSTAETAPPEVSSGGPGVLPYVLGGVGAAGIGGFFLFNAWGNSDNKALAQCSPNCSQSSVDHIQKMYLAADISLGVGLASLGAATYFYLSSMNSTEEKAPKRSAYMIGVQPTPSGFFASASGSF